MTFIDPISVVKQELERIRTQVELVIVLYHGGLERDPQNGQPTEVLTGENVGYALTQLNGIDLLITGHQHRSIITTINNTLITQCAYNASEFAKVEVDFDHVPQLQATLIKMKDFPQDESVLALIQDWQDQTQRWLDQPVGHLEGHDYLIHDPFEARLHKHPLVSLINQIQMDASGAQLSGVSLFNEPVGFKPQCDRTRSCVHLCLSKHLGCQTNQRR